MDITQLESIAALYRQGGMFDAVACAAGEVPWAALEDLTYDALLRGAQIKLLGQVELVRQGITTSGIHRSTGHLRHRVPRI